MSMQVYAGTCKLNQVYTVYYLDYFPNGCKNTHLNDRFRVAIVFQCCNLFIRDVWKC